MGKTQMQEQEQKEQKEISAPVGYVRIEEMGKDEKKELMRRIKIECEYADKTERPARTLTKSGELVGFVAAAIVKSRTKKISVVVGTEPPCVIRGENIAADYHAFAAVFEKVAEKMPLCAIRIKTFIRADKTTYSRAYITLSDDAPIYVKEMAD